MHWTNLLAWNHRTITLSLIVATATVAAVLALSSSLAHGSSRGMVGGVTVSPGDAPGELNVSWDAPSPARQPSYQQVNRDSPATMKECRDELAAGRAVLCKRNSFSVKTVRPDGGYSIDWSVWANQHSTVDRYTIQRLRFLYRYRFKLEADGTAVDSSGYTTPAVNSCVPRVAETDNVGAAIRWAWTCKGISNVREDPFGVPTSIEQLEEFDDDWTSESWTSSLLAPGRKPDIPVQALRVPGDRTGPHADNPQNARDRLTQQRVDDGAHNLLTTEVEMHLYLITVHFDDGTTERHYELLDGASFDDRE